ncbi:polyketide biosynthesis protein [Rhodobacterales bacterium 52_120_T64]|nr:polyketide biosynthesis protein [Rhodobacterales bacterium 52_120_T64]
MEPILTTLDIISDPICPWCYIGKAKLDRALEAAPDHPFEIQWRPFQLNPDMPAEGMDRREYLEWKFGGREGAIRIYGEIAKKAEETGLDIAFEKIKRTPNTLNAHRLIRWAQIEEKQSQVVSQLFRRYFREGQDISDIDVLVDVATAVGMDGDLIRRLLEGDSDLAETIAEDKKAREMGVQGVPCFIIGASYAVQGAQNTDTWAGIIAEIVEKSKT